MNRLRTRLVRYRDEANLTQVDVATTLDWSGSKMHRVENGPGRIQTSDLLALLTVYGVMDDDERDAMVDLARAARNPGISTKYKNSLSTVFAEYVDYEAYADVYLNYETKLVPGPIQIGGYADAIVEVFLGSEPDEQRDRVVDARNERARYLTGKDGPVAKFIIDEMALHRAIGGEESSKHAKYDSMVRLFRHLRAVNSADAAWSGDGNPNLEIQIVPFEVGAYPAIRGPFVVLDFEHDDDPRLAYLENPTGEQIIRDVEATSRYYDDFHSLSAQIPPASATNGILDYIESTFSARLNGFPWPELESD